MASSDGEMEFRYYLDDAWYVVPAVRAGEEKLRVKYSNFAEDHDEVFEARKFESVEKLQEFGCRFGPVSLQLQDAECSKVVEGWHLCASNNFDGSDIRFYDSVVEHVAHKMHSFARGGRRVFVCLHNPLAAWSSSWENGGEGDQKHMPCPVYNTKLDPKVASFLDIAMEKIG